AKGWERVEGPRARRIGGRGGGGGAPPPSFLSSYPPAPPPSFLRFSSLLPFAPRSSHIPSATPYRLVFSAVMDFQVVVERVAEIRSGIADAVKRGGHGQSVRVIAVTKTHGPEAVLAAAAAGITDVGENKVQEALSKREALTAAG